RPGTQLRNGRGQVPSWFRARASLREKNVLSSPAESKHFVGRSFLLMVGMSTSCETKHRSASCFPVPSNFSDTELPTSPIPGYYAAKSRSNDGLVSRRFL